MYAITKARQLADKIFLMDVKAPWVAKRCMPGSLSSLRWMNMEREFLLQSAIIIARREQ